MNSVWIMAFRKKISGGVCQIKSLLVTIIEFIRIEIKIFFVKEEKYLRPVRIRNTVSDHKA